MSDADPWPAPEDARRDPANLCANCGKTIYWRQPSAKLGLTGGWKHEMTGFAGCGFGAVSVASPREDDTP